MNYCKVSFIFILVSFIGACATQPMQMDRQPALGAQSQVSVGDAMYTFNVKAGSMTMYSTTGGSSTTGGGGVKLELLYSGVANNQLRITYREFQHSTTQAGAASSFIRPAFSQDVQYDYDGQPTEVNFKGVNISVINADQRSITYKVNNGFREEDVMVKDAECVSYRNSAAADKVKPDHC